MTIYVVVPLLVLVAVLQATAMPHLAVWGVFPDLPVLMVASWGLLRGARQGLLWGFVAGVAVDLLSAAPSGTATLSLMAVGALSGLGASSLSRASFVLPPVTVFLVTIVYDLIFLLFVQMSGGAKHWPDMLVHIVLPSAVLNALLMPVVFWPMSRLHAWMGREEMAW